MDRLTFGKKTLNTQRPRVDRFVAPRESFPEIHRRTVWGSQSQCRHRDPINVLYTKHLQQKRYTSYIDDAFGLEPPKVQASWEDEQGRSPPPWPCVPRKKNYLSSADSILDLPTYSYAPFPELLDWSSGNILVAALGRRYHKWSWRTQNLIGEGFTDFQIHCCKFDPRGELLALGTNVKAVEIHDNELSKWIQSGFCKCSSEDDQLCFITALDWSPTGNSYITGCSRGMLMSSSRKSETISWHRAFHAAIVTVRVSPDARFVAATALNVDSVFIFSWPSLKKYSSLSSNWTVKTLAWHPWRSALLAIGSMSPGQHARLVLWNAPSSRGTETTLSNSLYSLDAMLFSNRTGELVLSLWNLSPDWLPSKPRSQLLVMSDPDTVVDQWGEGQTDLDRVRMMIFSPDGTKLATATADEDLIIWNFLPEDGKKKKNRRFSAMPVYLDEASNGVSLR